MWIEAVASTGRAVEVELRIRLDTVEVYAGSTQLAVMDRDALRQWWNAPRAPFAIDEVTFSLDHAIDVRGCIAITVPEVNAWVLSPSDAERVYRRL